MSYWIIPITEENWRIVKEKNIYGVRKISKSIRKIQKNDYLIFYITKRNCSEYCGSFAGIYKVENNWYEERTLLWPDEQRLQKVLYPYKIKITPIITGNTPATNLINQLSFIKNKNKWFLYFRGTPANYDNPIPEEDAKIIQEHLSQQQGISHAELVNSIINIYTLLGYYPVKEFKVNSYVMDIVLWNDEEKYNDYMRAIETKRPPLQRTLPLAVFEVQLKGNVDMALSRLKHAYDSWGCKLFLVISRDKDFERTRQLLGEMLSGAFHEIRNHVEIVMVEDLINFAKNLRIHEKLIKQLIKDLHKK